MNRKVFKIYLSAMLGILLLGGVETFPQVSLLDFGLSKNSTIRSKPKLYTEKSLYQVTDNVVLRGVGFLPFEPVRLTVRRMDNTTLKIFKYGLVSEWIAFADESGRFTANWAVGFVGDRFLIEAAGEKSKSRANIDFIVITQTDIDQCSNGTFKAPQTCAGANWIHGSLNANQAHYVETESVPYRLIFEGLSTTGSHTVTIEYETTTNGKHGIDYLTSFNRTETDADPCSDVPGCNPAAFSTFAIPIDANVANGFDGLPGTSDDITQVPGNFTFYGGTITGVSAYTVTGTYDGTSQTRSTITFTTTVSNPVLAWGGHIASRQDWGKNYSAIAINGASFHIRLYEVDGGGGAPNRSLHSDSIFYPGQITIIKDAQPNTTQLFGFTAGGPAVSDFSLDDDGDNANTYANTQNFSNLTNFGVGHEVTVTENSPTNPYFLNNILCTSEANGGDGTNNNKISISNREVEISLEEGEYVTCTFVNMLTTAATAFVSGQVINADGQGIYNVRLTLLKVSTGEAVVLQTNPFGYYTFRNLNVGEDYVITVSSKRYVFNPSSRVFSLLEDAAGLDFPAEPLE